MEKYEAYGQIDVRVDNQNFWNIYHSNFYLVNHSELLQLYRGLCKLFIG